MKSQVPIDSLLVWAFRDGAPPNLGHSARTMFDARFFELGTVIDAMTFREVDFIDDRHPDAVIVQETVFAFCQTAKLRRINWHADSVGLLGSLAYRLTEQEITSHGCALGDYGVLYDAPSVNPGALVLQYAICGGFPRWNFGERLVQKQVKKGAMPQLRLVCDNGMGKQVDISPVEIARARFEYRLWYESVCDLAPKIPEMKDHEAIHLNADYEPWIIKKPGSVYNELINNDFQKNFPKSKKDLTALGT